MTMKAKAGAGGAAAAIALAVAFIAPWEGVELRAYRDIVGIPTICYGETRGVNMGDSATLAECQTMLAVAVADFEKGIRPCLPASLPDVVGGRDKGRAGLVGQAGLLRVQHVASGQGRRPARCLRGADEVEQGRRQGGARPDQPPHGRAEALP